MRVKFPSLSLCLLLLLTHTAFAANTQTLVRNALSANATESAAAIAELRALGPAGLEALIQTHKAEINRQIENPTLASNAEWRRLSATLDGVSQQRDSYLSQLYWYTDFDEAREAARATGKPILSLRLLGKLTDELSCANSRFFRSILYANATVSQTLRDRFVLHWQSVRNAPKITIDFGDGRRIERTITGNSIHYILDSEGRPIDALPGLYGPAAFLRGLSDAETIFKEINGKEINERNFALVKYHRERAGAVSVAWLNDNAKIGGKEPNGLLVRKDASGQALEIMPLAVTKAVTESSMLRSITAGADALGRITDEAAWNKIAALHSADAELDARSVGLIQRQTRGLLAYDKSGVDATKFFQNLTKKLRDSIALDTVRNEYFMHTKLHAWLSRGPDQQNVEQLNEKVYAELFLTPSSDPWLGLLSADTYNGLDNGGVVK